VRGFVGVRLRAGFEQIVASMVRVGAGLVASGSKRNDNGGTCLYKPGFLELKKKSSGLFSLIR